MLLAVAAWCLVFLVPHLYWAAGGRRGLGSEVVAMDVAFSQPWFVAYNGATALACVVGAGGALALLARRGGRYPRWWWRAALALAVLLGLRAAAGLPVDLAAGDLASPPVLVAVEIWFAVGALVFAGLARDLRTARAGRGATAPAGAPPPPPSP